jgi:hypothetical protein
VELLWKILQGERAFGWDLRVGNFGPLGRDFQKNLSGSFEATAEKEEGDDWATADLEPE